MKIVYDNDVSFRIAHALRELVGEDHHVVALRDLYPEIWPGEIDADDLGTGVPGAWRRERRRSS